MNLIYLVVPLRELLSLRDFLANELSAKPLEYLEEYAERTGNGDIPRAVIFEKVQKS